MTGKLNRGIIQVYTGNGKGKTTASFGQAIRSFGAGFRVFIVQFLKDGNSGEVTALRKIAPEITIETFGSSGFIKSGGPSGEDKKAALAGLEKCIEIMSGDCPDLLILDEICTAVSMGVLDEDSVLSLLERKPLNLELILTGRNATPRIISKADLVTEMREVKHPFQNGLQARKGVEY